jgi:hypothetical protein
VLNRLYSKFNTLERKKNARTSPGRRACRTWHVRAARRVGFARMIWRQVRSSLRRALRGSSSHRTRIPARAALGSVMTLRRIISGAISRAADWQFLQRRRQARSRTSNRKAARDSWSLLVSYEGMPRCLTNIGSGALVLEHEPLVQPEGAAVAKPGSAPDHARPRTDPGERPPALIRRARAARRAAITARAVERR